MKYRCLVFDHDDTVVNSTATIHHPCFQLFLDKYFPGRVCSLEQYFLKNFSPGFLEMCRQDYGMDEAMIAEEGRFWMDYVQSHVPAAYDGIRRIMERQKAAGGLVAVVSHSHVTNILRDYAGQTVVIGTHGTALSTILNYYNPNFGLQDFLRIVNRMPCIMEMTFSGEKLLGISELAHVEKEMPL